MEQYNIIFYNDMGHLMIEKLFDLPTNITTFAYNVIRNKINYATDKNNNGCRFYILKNGLNDKWSYIYNNVQINIDYSKLDKFYSNSMIYI
jgi:hypothetical protein